MTRSGRPTPLAALVGGVVAAACGTLAMDLLLFVRYRRGGGTSGFFDWEFSAGVTTWEQAPAPAQVGRRLVDGLFQVTLPDSRARLVNNVMHWGYGMSAGAPYGLVVGSLRVPHAWLGPPFGATVWASSYVVLPAAKLYKPIWEYDARTLFRDLSAHLVYGSTTGAVFGALIRGPGGTR